MRTKVSLSTGILSLSLVSVFFLYGSADLLYYAGELLSLNTISSVLFNSAIGLTFLWAAALLIKRLIRSSSKSKIPLFVGALAQILVAFFFLWMAYEIFGAPPGVPFDMKVAGVGIIFLALFFFWTAKNLIMLGIKRGPNSDY